MAVIDHKILSKYPEWKKLTPSARGLLANGIATLTDKTGFGSPSIYALMTLSGIGSKATFYNAVKGLKNAGLVEFKKKWQVLFNENGRKIPHARVEYQISKNVLWNKDRFDNQNHVKDTTCQSIVSESTVSRKEGVTSLGVNNVNNTAEAVGYKTYKGIKPVGAILASSSVQALFKPRISYSSDEKWQTEASRIAAKLGIKETTSWFRFFKEAYQKGREGLLDAATSFLSDAQQVENKEHLFYWKFNQFLKGKNP